MKFETVLHLLMKRFNEEGIAFVLSGGLALSTMDVARFTSDIDFIIYEEDKERVNRIMTELGYERQSYSSDEIVCYCSPLRVFGQVDFLIARRKYTRTMMQKATEKPLFGGRLNVHAVRPEDLIGLKVQAICNDPDNRYLIDKPDIQRLLKLHRAKMDMDLVREYFRIFDKEAWLNEWLQEIDG
ncbi:nucleotidyl transferase AbiEii/AbiGii toxin family protein [Desulfatirhabdium butyrativorans]|uniref:nucleotidyl transferase AbiEii/AbiGii toxin family protein n=1 Tax=Desulfatirhabdium butyrativorans TaxID=340467 RepID=UPI0003F8BB23|nr:nucleotidyl transferase AbiEii/AbiGii toxin family protein [Desulfatirhabdium butyrativorans]